MKLYEFRLRFHWIFVPKGSIENIPALVHIMAWRRLGDKPLSEPMKVSLLSHKCVTRPQGATLLSPHIPTHLSVCLLDRRKLRATFLSIQRIGQSLTRNVRIRSNEGRVKKFKISPFIHPLHANYLNIFSVVSTFTPHGRHWTPLIKAYDVTVQRYRKITHRNKSQWNQHHIRCYEVLVKCIFCSVWVQNLREISAGTAEISQKMLNPYTAKYVIY